MYYYSHLVASSFKIFIRLLRSPFTWLVRVVVHAFQVSCSPMFLYKHKCYFSFFFLTEWITSKCTHRINVFFFRICCSIRIYHSRFPTGSCLSESFRQLRSVLRVPFFKFRNDTCRVRCLPVHVNDAICRPIIIIFISAGGILLLPSLLVIPPVLNDVVGWWRLSLLIGLITVQHVVILPWDACY